MKVALIILGSFLGLVLIAIALAALGGPMGRGRWVRLVRIGNLSARLWTSWVGVKLRRLFAGAERRKRIDSAARKASAQRVAETMGQMKGAAMKLGQMLSFVTDDIPEEYRVALASLQASAPPMDFALLRDVAESELGMPLERAFASFDEKPLASASIGQVHRATLPSGEQVVVKIQYPGVADAIKADLDNFGMIYTMTSLMFPMLEPGPVVEELRERVVEELDYSHEAKNQRAFHDLYRDHPFIRVPRVIDSHSSARVLTSEFVSGRRWQEALSSPGPQRQRYAEVLYRFVFGSITRFGVFNGDPHPGNYLFDDQGRVVFLDFGCVKFFPPAMRRDWRSLQAAHIAGDRAQFHAQTIKLGFLRPETDVTPDLIYDYFNYFYEPFREDRIFTFNSEYNSKSFGMVFRPQGAFAGLQKKLNMPRDFVFVNRIQWGVVSLLAQLEGQANWHQIHHELLFDAPPSTELGRADHAYRIQWRLERGLEEPGDLALTQAGVQRVA